VLLNRDIALLTASGDAKINGIKLEAIKAYQPPDCFFFNGVQTLAADQNTFHLIHRWVISSPLFRLQFPAGMGCREGAVFLSPLPH